MKNCIPPCWVALVALLILCPVARATTVIAPDFDSLVSSSDYIVRAVVQSVRTEWRPDPSRPAHRYIGTLVALAATGGTVAFSVIAAGSAPLSYQWLFNGNPIAGATGTSHMLTSVTAAQAGTYSVTVSNSAGSVTSNGASLTVAASAPVQPPTPTPTPAPTPSSGGGGGGGAPSIWFVAMLAGLGGARSAVRHRSR
ncbi:MAG TPA: hypothetical protein VG734_12475 [Lacunisphaera sp.]|nr:hypothetical protein [Lacunisphaera sp.]